MGIVMTDAPVPGTQEWLRLITPSKIPIILGVSPFKSPYALWHEMHGDINPPPISQETENVFAWGHDAEDSLVNWWRRHNPGWRTNSGEIAYTDPELPFPNLATLDRRAVRGRAYKIIECKTTREIEQWGAAGTTDSAPVHYTAQALGQMGISGIHDHNFVVHAFGYPEIHPCEWNEDVWLAIIPRLEEWHQSLVDGNPPDLDDELTTYETVRGLHPDIERGKNIDIDPALAQEYLAACKASKDAQEVERGYKTRVLDAMGTAHKAMVGGVKIADRRPGRGGHVSLYCNTKADLNEP